MVFVQFLGIPDPGMATPPGLAPDRVGHSELKKRHGPTSAGYGVPLASARERKR